MTALETPIPAEQLTIVPGNEASWDDLAAIFGTRPSHDQRATSAAATLRRPRRPGPNG